MCQDCDKLILCVQRIVWKEARRRCELHFLHGFHDDKFHLHYHYYLTYRTSQCVQVHIHTFTNAYTLIYPCYGIYFFTQYLQFFCIFLFETVISGESELSLVYIFTTLFVSQHAIPIQLILSELAHIRHSSQEVLRFYLSLICTVKKIILRIFFFSSKTKGFSHYTTKCRYVYGLGKYKGVKTFGPFYIYTYLLILFHVNSM